MPTLELTIERLAKSGDGVAQHQGRAVFVAGALAGEKVRAEVRESGKVLVGELLEVLTAAPERRVPPCPLAGTCGGCDWMHLDEAAQLREKVDIVLSALAHVGGIEREQYRLLPPVASPRALGTRRRATLHPVDGRLGFYGRRTHERVPVGGCIALSPLLATLPGRLADALQPVIKDFEDVQLLEASGHAALSIQLRAQVRPKHRELIEALLRSGTVRGVYLHPGEGRGVSETFGKPVLEEDGLYLRPDAFAQANTEVNRLMVARAVEWLRLSGTERVLELYSGNGNFTFAMSPAASQVVAVESSAVSASLGQQAARRFGTSNVRFVQGDAEKLVAGYIKESERFDRVLVDPPRTGAPGLGGWMERLLVKRVVYVACDPAALARDAAELASKGYAPEALQIFDLFPQTHHVEAIMAFARAGA